jgi:hypothetical protein
MNAHRIILLVLIFVSSGTAVFAQAPQAAATTLREAVRRVPASDLVQSEARRSDSLWNGAAIGAAVGVTSGLLLCRATEPWRNCRDDVGPMLGMAALGAGIGIGIDALIRGRETANTGGAGTTRLQVTPIAARRAKGMQVSLRF